MKKDSLQLLKVIAQKLFDKKGFNIIAIDVREVSTMTDFFLIAEGAVDRHVRAMAQEVMEAMKEEGEKPVYSEGLSESDWIVLDYLEIVIHLLVPKMRDKYRLEELWQAGKIVDLELEVSKGASS
jgi:ribosome-associated protein